MKKIRVLVVQYKINYLDVRGNIAKFRRILKKYSYLKSDLVIFPEYALTGPLYSNYSLAFSDDAVISELRNIALRYKVNLIPGSFIRRVSSKMYNSTCFISAEGNVQTYYNKQFLWSSENRFLQKGNEVGVIDTKIGRIALQICADLHSSDISAKYRMLKPDIIINVAMWSKEDIKACTKKVPDTIELLQTEYLARARALENRAYMIFCNFAGTIKIKAKTGRVYEETSIGNSLVVNPFGEIIAKVSDNGEEVICSEIDISSCHWSRYAY